MSERTAIITGAASGIGLETVRRFALNSKYNPIYALDKNPRLPEIYPHEKFPSVVPVELDVRQKEQVKVFLNRSFTESGRIDVIVNAAGVMFKGKPWSFLDDNQRPVAEFDEMRAVNESAPIWFMWEALTPMSVNGGGTIINITSSKYLFPDIYHTHYQSGKEYLSQVTRRAARSPLSKDFNIRFVDLQPGNTRTNIEMGGWTEKNSRPEMEAAQSIANWWRRTFGNDPRNVAEVIYEVAEGRRRGTTIRVGLDANLGNALYWITYLLGPYRSDIVFFSGSYIFYQGAKLIRMLEGKNKVKP